MLKLSLGFPGNAVERNQVSVEGFVGGSEGLESNGILNGI